MAVSELANGRLADQSLVTVIHDEDGEVRYHLPETVRAHALAARRRRRDVSSG